jgi:hypothetical protein
MRRNRASGTDLGGQVMRFVFAEHIYMSQDPLTPISLTPNVTPLNNVLTDINFIKFTVGLKVYII